jgi:hypothetical protein
VKGVGSVLIKRQKWRELKNGEWSGVQWIEVTISGEMCTLSLIYSYVALCRFCVIHCVIILCLPLLFSNYWTCVFNILFKFVFLFLYLFSILCILCFCIVLCIISSFLYTAVPFLFFVQVYWPLPPGGNPTAVNKCIISYYIFNSMWIYQQLTILRQEWMIYSKLQQSVQLSHSISTYEQCKFLHLISYAFQSYSHKTHC